MKPIERTEPPKEPFSERDEREILLPAPDYRALFDAMPDACLILDRELRIVAFNHAYLKITMTTGEQLLGRHLFDVFPDNPDDPEPRSSIVRASLNRVLKSGVTDTQPVLKYDIRKPETEGGGFEERYWSSINAPVFGPDHRVAFIIHRAQDVTEFVRLKRRGTEEQHLTKKLREQALRMEAEIFARNQEVAEVNLKLKRAVEELEQANQELEAFNHMISHDLRQPLNAIGASCQSVEMLCGGVLGTDCKNYLRMAYRKVKSMNGQINALLTFSRSAHSALRHEVVDLSAMARGVAAEVRLSEPQRKATFIIADHLEAHGDPDLMRSVLENLIGNAWKYTRDAEEARIEVGMVADDGEPAFFVRDNGRGFDMAHATELFHPFKRLPGSDDYRGFGIGLGTVSRIVQRHGGKVWAEGAPGKGATFYFTLPLEKDGTPSRAEGHGKGMQQPEAV